MTTSPQSPTSSAARGIIPSGGLAELCGRLRQIVGAEAVLSNRTELLVYECDGYVLEKNSPDIVVFPRSTAQVAEIVKLANQFGVPFVPRGAGTSLAGGCLPVGGGIMIVLTRLNRIEELNTRDRYAVVQPGVVNSQLNTALKGSGWHYAPDPSSQGACTIGGNVATNAGGPHTLKYGVTVNHVLGLEAVLPDGQIVQLGGPVPDELGCDLVGGLVGGEGTLAIITKIWVRLTPNPAGWRTLLAIFESVDQATTTISEIIGQGIIPAALEMLDQGIIVPLEAAFGFGFPTDAGALLLIEVDGLEAGLDEQRTRIHQICLQCGAREVRLAASDAERAKLWKARKQAFGAVGRLSPCFCTQDGVVPRTKLPWILRQIQEIGQRYNLTIVNVFHAGDGNIHPILCFDERDPDQVQRVLAAGMEILRACLACGGSVTGEHGIGVEKLSLMHEMFTPEDLRAMERYRAAWNPRQLLSPQKLLPTAGGCGMEHIHPEQIHLKQTHPGRRAAL
ncbi:MAG: FAD-linked oxidase C-terminal domain-containing protein [Pirellulales bacterium]|nr:FAD-linked oxidase C-terminal domain-containing protein [Pirellulales bacterium]